MSLIELLLAMRPKEPKEKRKAGFQMQWLSDEKYKHWLRKKSDSHGTCILCKKDFSIETMGESGVKSHTDSIRHQKLVKEQTEARNSLSILHFVPPPNPPASSIWIHYKWYNWFNSGSSVGATCRNSMGIEGCNVAFFNAIMPWRERTIPSDVPWQRTNFS